MAPADYGSGELKNQSSGTSRLWPMLAALIGVFALSHAFRTVVTVVAGPLAAEFELSAQALGVLAGSFHLAFALAQPIVGVALDRYGPRRTVLVAFALGLTGSAVSAGARNFTVLLLSQWLIGFGCAPALLAAMVFILRRYPAHRFAPLTSIVFTVGGLGMLISATPLAWIVERISWRAGLVALSLLAALAWLAVWWWVDDEPIETRAPRQTLQVAARDLRTILVQRHTAGICCLAAVSYAAFISLRGLWLGPLLAGRYGFSLVEIGHVASAITVAGLLAPVLFGRLDPGGRARRVLIIACSWVYMLLFAALAVGVNRVLDVGLVIFSGFFLGYVVFQYADLQSAYPKSHAGRALSVFTMAMFGGVAAMQWLSGYVASIASSQGSDAVSAALLAVALLLGLGTIGFWLLPWPPDTEVSNDS